MRCGRAEKLIDRYVDGRLPEEMAREVALHESSCARCAARIGAARGLTGALAEEPILRAPNGFVDRVMDSVYREALTSARQAAGSEERNSALHRIYRRLGLSVMLSAAVLTASLIVPRAFYPLPTEAVAAGFSRDRPSLVKDALGGAGRAVSETLRSIGGGEK